MAFTTVRPGLLEQCPPRDVCHLVAFVVQIITTPVALFDNSLHPA